VSEEKKQDKKEINKQVFICYSRKDKKWKDRIVKHLTLLEMQDELIAWDDGKIKPGANWEEEIEQALSRATVALLLVSADFLISDFITKKEIPTLLKKHQEKGVTILPVLLYPCMWNKVDWLKKMQFFHREKVLGKYESDDKKVKREQLLTELGDEILSIHDPKHSSQTTEGRDTDRNEKQKLTTVSASSTQYLNLFVGLHHLSFREYRIELRISTPNQDHQDLKEIETARFRLNLPELRKHLSEPITYGHFLTASFFSDQDIRRIFNQALDAAAERELKIRVRLNIGPSAQELNEVHWELLHRISDNGQPSEQCLLHNKSIWFSRFLMSSGLDWETVHFRAKPQALSATILVFNPKRHKSHPALQHHFAMQPDKEMQDAKEILSNRLLTTIEGASTAPLSLTLETPVIGNATLGALSNQMDRNLEGFDIVYFVCHAVIEEGEACLVLDDDVGEIRIVRPALLTAALKRMERPPRLMLLVPPLERALGQTAQTNDRGALAQLATAIQAAGVAAVVTFQGNMSQASLALFLMRFIDQLRESDGLLSHAMTAGRQALIEAEKSDWWMPICTTRLKSSRIWYEAGFQNSKEGRGDEAIWSKLIQAIHNKKCTPIIGSSLIRPIIGSRSDIAKQWADQYHFPMAYQDKAHLSQVAQFVKTQLDPPEFEKVLAQTLMETLNRKHAERVGVEFNPDFDLDAQITNIGKVILENQDEPHNILARMALPIYLTTGLSYLMELALEKQDKEPQGVVFRIPKEEGKEITEQDTEEYEFSAKKPLVYHLYGRFSDPINVVLTEDDYFRFLMAFQGERAFIPPQLRAALTDACLLFVGFQIHKWDFRVMFRALQTLEGRGLLEGNIQIAVQIDPDDDQVMDPDHARRYLEKYFTGHHVKIYWGTVEYFLREIDRRLPNDSSR